MKTVFFERLRYKLVTKNDFYYGSCPDIHIPLQEHEYKIIVSLDLHLVHALLEHFFLDAYIYNSLLYKFCFLSTFEI